MRKQDLRAATRKAAEESLHCPGARLHPREIANRKRMASVATVYDIEAHELSPEAIMGLSPDEGNGASPRPTNKRVWASVEREPEDVIEDMFREALRRDPEKSRAWVILVDGGEKQLDLVLDCIRQYRPNVSLILDFIHGLEYLWKAAYAFHAVGRVKAEHWVPERAVKILRGRDAKVVEGLRQDGIVHQLSSEKRGAVDKCLNYVEKYAPMFEYDQYLTDALPIATGVVEGACRHLIKDRIDRTGAHWRLRRAEAVVWICALRSSGDFEAYGRFHQAQARHRNHCLASANRLAFAA